MRTATVAEAQTDLPRLIAEAHGQVIALVDDGGNLAGFLSGMGEEEVDDLLIRTPDFQAMIERSRRSLAEGQQCSATPPLPPNP